MVRTDVPGVAGALIVLARVHRRRARAFRRLAQTWRDDPKFDFVVARRRRQRTRAYEQLANGEIAEAKRLESLAKPARAASEKDKT